MTSTVSGVINSAHAVAHIFCPTHVMWRWNVQYLLNEYYDCFHFIQDSWSL